MENIDMDIDIDRAVLENIDSDKEILENIDIDKISNRLEFGISNRAIHEQGVLLLLHYFSTEGFDFWKHNLKRRSIKRRSS